MKITLYSDHILLYPFQVEPTRGSIIIPDFNSTNLHPDERTRPRDMPMEHYEDFPVLGIVIAAGKDSQAKKGDVVMIDMRMAGADPFPYEGVVFHKIRGHQLIGHYGDVQQKMD